VFIAVVAAVLVVLYMIHQLSERLAVTQEALQLMQTKLAAMEQHSREGRADVETKLAAVEQHGQERLAVTQEALQRMQTKLATMEEHSRESRADARLLMRTKLAAAELHLEERVLEMQKKLAAVEQHSQEELVAAVERRSRDTEGRLHRLAASELRTDSRLATVNQTVEVLGAKLDTLAAKFAELEHNISVANYTGFH